MPSIRNGEAESPGLEWQGRVFLWDGGDLNREVFIWFLKRFDLISIDTAQQTHTGTQRPRA